MSNRKSKFSLLIILSTILTSCIYSDEGIIHISNNIPKAKLVLEKDPSKEAFYAADYNSVTQSIYNKNIEIILLKDGDNNICIDENKSYALYFVLPGTYNKLNNWKFLLGTKDKKLKYAINSEGQIKKG